MLIAVGRVLILTNESWIPRYGNSMSNYESIVLDSGSSGSSRHLASARVRRTVGPPLLFDLSSIDLSARQFDRAAIAEVNPHRDAMALLDHIVWTSADFTRGVGFKRIRDDDFWSEGHFPGRPVFPGVLMVETAAQLGGFLNAKRPSSKQRTLVLTRVESVSFRTLVRPGHDLYLLCSEVRFTRRHFVSDIQGVADGRVAFAGRISGMSVART